MEFHYCSALSKKAILSEFNRRVELINATGLHKKMDAFRSLEWNVVVFIKSCRVSQHIYASPGNIMLAQQQPGDCIRFAVIRDMPDEFVVTYPDKAIVLSINRSIYVMDKFINIY